MKTPASSSRVSGDVNAPARPSAPPPLLQSTSWRMCASILEYSQCFYIFDFTAVL